MSSVVQENLSGIHVVQSYVAEASATAQFAAINQRFQDSSMRLARVRGRMVPVMKIAASLGTLVVLWYAEEGQEAQPAQRERPWYKRKVSPTFADMLACCRLHLWRHWLAAAGTAEEQERRWDWLLNYLSTAS